jgi:uncharacterized protein (TIRG00374 family)
MKFNSKYLGVIGIVVLIYILLTIDIPKVISIIKSVNVFYLIMAILINPLVLILLTERWKRIVQTMGVELKYTKYLKIRLRGVFLGNISPGKIGDFYRAKDLSEETDLEIAQSLSSVIIDRILDICALIVLNFAGMIIIISFFDVTAFWIETVLFTLIIITGLFLIAKKKLMKKLLRPLYRIIIPKSSKQNIAIHFNQFYRGLSELNFGDYSMGFMLSIAIWGLTAIGTYLLALALGMDVPLIFMIAMVPIATLTSALPISVGGLGTREAVYIFFLAAIDIESEYAVGLSILVFIFLNLIYVPFGIASYIFQNRNG